jgi:hypothetical protein
MNPTETTGYISFFHDILTTPAGSLPKGAQWLVAFSDLKANILPGITEALRRESKPWLIDLASEAITNDIFQKNSGCVFCQAIAIPGEIITTNAAGNIETNSFLKTYVGGGRTLWPELRMSFFDSNISFADSFLRAWAISTANFGMLARYRGTTENYRTDLTCWKLGSYAPDYPPTVLMKVTFYDICCVSVSEEELTYEAATAYFKREAKFIYNHYSIDTVGGNAEFLSNASMPKSHPSSPPAV